MKQNEPHTMEKFNPRVICGGALAILNIEWEILKSTTISQKITKNEVVDFIILRDFE